MSDEKPLPAVDLIDAPKLPPFALKDGPIPILIVLHRLAGADERAVCQEGKFVPFMIKLELELMAKRP